MGVSVPLSGKGRAFGKVGVGPISWTGTRGDGQSAKAEPEPPVPLTEVEAAAIEALRADRQFLERLQNNGLPLRGVQERLKEEIPCHLADPDGIAYLLVPQAMALVFGPQGNTWITVKRPSRSGGGTTTWIEIR